MLNQQNTDCEYGVVFCDWLDVTFSELNNTCQDFIDWFVDLGFEVRSSNEEEKLFTLICGVIRSAGSASTGVLKITSSRSIIRVSLSGVVLEYLRLSNKLDETLAFFSEFPFHITRIDSALDLDVIGWKRIKDLRKKHPEFCALTERALRTKSILSRGLEGRSTGTFYVGHNSKAGVSARCYDKRHQVWETTGVDLGFNVFRYEITTRFKRDRGGASFRDVSDPTSLFYKYASPSLLRKPKGVSDWESSTEFTFSVPELEKVLPAQKIKRLVSESYLLERIAKLSLEEGSGGVDYAISVITRELRSNLVKLESDTEIISM